MPTAVASLSDMHDENASEHKTAGSWLDARLDRAKSSGVFAELVDITPALAREFLSRNEENRPLRHAKLSQFIADLTAGRWELNGESLIFSVEGRMNDGQHRCEAVIRTGITMKTMVMFGLSRASRRTVDSGAARTPGDHLAIEGYSYPTEMASLVRFLLAYEKTKGVSFKDLNKVSATEVVDRAMSDPLVVRAARFSRIGYARSRTIAPPSVLGFCYYVFSSISPDLADVYLEQVISGVNLSNTSPAYAIREKLISLGRDLREHRIEHIFTGWNAMIEGREIQRLVITNRLPTLAVPEKAKPKKKKAGAATATGPVSKSRELPALAVVDEQ